MMCSVRKERAQGFDFLAVCAARKKLQQSSDRVHGSLRRCSVTGDTVNSQLVAFVCLGKAIRDLIRGSCLCQLRFINILKDSICGIRNNIGCMAAMDFQYLLMGKASCDLAT